MLCVLSLKNAFLFIQLWVVNGVQFTRLGLRQVWEHRPYLEGVYEWLAGLEVLAVVVIHYVKGVRGEAGGIGRAAPDHARAALGQACVLAKGRLGAQLGLRRESLVNVSSAPGQLTR